MNEQELLAEFEAVLKTSGMCKCAEAAVIRSLAHDCVEVVRIRSSYSNSHPLAKLAAQTRLERVTKYEYEGRQVAMDLPYGASSILTELYKKLMALIIADKVGKLTLESAKEELKDLTVWEELLWDYLELGRSA